MDTLIQDLQELLLRFEAEMAYNAKKGQSPYRQGMHDGLFFGRDQLAIVLREHGIDVPKYQPSSAPPAQYGL